MKDKSGRPYAKFSEVKPGSVLETDAGFTCVSEGRKLTVLAAPDGLYIPCGHGRHYIDGQLKTWHDGFYYSGLYLVKP